MAACGLSLDVLYKAAEAASLHGVTLDEYAIAEGLVNEEHFYETLARQLQRPFTLAPIPLANIRSPRSQVATGVMMTRPGALEYRYVLAPRGVSLRALLQDRSQRLANVAITTPSHLEAEVLRQSERALVQEASLGLWQKAPDLSALDTLSYTQLFFIGFMVFIGGFIFATDWQQALDMVSLASGGVFLLFMLVRLYAIWASSDSRPDAASLFALPDHALPDYTLIVALYREASVARKLAHALASLDYPAAKLDILIVLEEDDIETRAAFAALNLPSRFHILVAPNGTPRTKPRALNLALPFAQGEFIAVYDAEDEPDAGQLREAAAKFARNGPELACVQARLCIENQNDSIYSRLFAIEYAALFDVINPGYSALGLAFPLGGTSNHFRAQALREVGGWDAWNVTEDADLGFRLGRANYRIDTIDSSTHEEAPITLKAWLGQRRRWMKGWMQTLLVHSRHPLRLIREIGLKQTFGIAVTLFGTVIGALAAPAYIVFLARLALGALSLIDNETDDVLVIGFSLGLCVIGLISMFWAASLGLIRRGRKDQLIWTLALPLYYLLVSYAAWRALFELMYRPYYWCKTEHGKSRRSVRPVDLTPSQDQITPSG